MKIIKKKFPYIAEIEMTQEECEYIMSILYRERKMGASWWLGGGIKQEVFEKFLELTKSN